VDELYRFLMAWVQHLYGDLDEELVESRGFELVDSDTELFLEENETGTETDRRSSQDGDVSDLTRESWEVSFLVVLFFLITIFIFPSLSFILQLLLILLTK
jgi:hypothetical protein